MATDYLTEEWRPVLCHEGLYEVSSAGRVRSLLRETPLILRAAIHSGYLFVVLHRPKRIVNVHTLVAEAFLGPRPEQQADRIEINHKDGIKLNCHKSNLEWSTRLKNMKHAAATGLMAMGKRNGTHTHPERIARGDRHWSVSHPEAILRGTLVWNSKLNEDKVSKIKYRLSLGHTRPSIARDFSVSLSTINAIACGRTWRHVTAPSS